MRLATLRDGSPDGRLLVVSADGARAIDARAAAGSLRAALDDWARTAGSLERLAQELTKGSPAAFDSDATQLAAPLPRAAQWVDGSAYLNHVKLVRKARNAAPPGDARNRPARLSRRRLRHARSARAVSTRRPCLWSRFRSRARRRAGRYPPGNAGRRGGRPRSPAGVPERLDLPQP